MEEWEFPKEGKVLWIKMEGRSGMTEIDKPEPATC
jgi:hypothetical protein